MRSHSPPGPIGWLDPVRLTCRHYLSMRLDPIRFFTRLGRRYGDIARFSLFGYRCYLVNHPELIRTVLVKHADDVRKLPRVVRTLKAALGDSLLTTEGQEWKQKRSALQQAFRSVELTRVAQLTVDEVNCWMARRSPACTLPIERTMNDMVQSIVTRFLFGTRLHDPDSVRDAVRFYSDRFYVESKALVPIPSWFPTFGNRRKRRSLQLVQSAIASAARDGISRLATRDDVLARLIRAIDDDCSGSMWDGEAAVKELMSLFVAGSHTLSVSLAWTWYLIATHPDVQERIREEVDRVASGRDIEPGDLEQLTYTRMVVDESLRLYPAAWELFGREVKRTIRLGAYDIPAGSLIMIAPVVTHRDARFFEDPLRFDPDRFSEGRRVAIAPFAYIPFGAGPHTCLGKTMTLSQMPLIVAAILKHDVVSTDRASPPKCVARVSMRPRRDIPIRFQRRPLVAADGGHPARQQVAAGGALLGESRLPQETAQ